MASGHTVVGLGAPQGPIRDGPGTEPIATAFGQRTLPPSITAPPVTQEAVMMRALDIAERVGAGVARSPSGWRNLLLVALGLVVLAMSVGGIYLWARHATSSNSEVLDRLDALEQAHDDRIDHDAWVVDALQALSDGEQLPPPPRPARRMLSKDRRSR